MANKQEGQEQVPLTPHYKESKDGIGHGNLFLGEEQKEVKKQLPNDIRRIHQLQRKHARGIVL